jgi:cytochrome P450
MLEMVEARRNSDNVEQRHDLLNGLLDAQDELDDGAALSDEELIGGYSMSRRLNFWKL